MELVPSCPAKISLCPQEQSSHWVGSCGHLIAAPSPALAAHWPMHPSAQPREMGQDICMLAGGKDWSLLSSSQCCCLGYKHREGNTLWLDAGCM